jgi:hypothetical protein
MPDHKFLKLKGFKKTSRYRKVTTWNSSLIKFLEIKDKSKGQCKKGQVLQ